MERTHNITIAEAESHPQQELVPAPKVEVEPEFEDFVPAEFQRDPLGYFEREGRNIKPGDIKRDEVGRVREDPTAVKELPVWKNPAGDELRVVGKRVTPGKAAVGESGDPFYEYRIMEIVNELGLPTAKPVAKVECGGAHLIIMEKINGVGWYEKETLRLREAGYDDADIEALKTQAGTVMMELKQRFDEAGIVRSWKLKDMIFDIDVEGKQVRAVVPTDWERTRIEKKRLAQYKSKKYHD